MIANLEEVVVKKSKTIEMLQDDINFLRLELLNREENLNRIFNSKPIIGAYNVASKKDNKIKIPAVPSNTKKTDGKSLKTINIE